MFFSTTVEAAAECLGRKGKRALNIPLKRHLLVPTSLGSSPLFARGKTSRGGHYVKSTSCTVTGHQSGQELWGAFTHADDEQSWCSPTTCSYEGHAVPLEGDRDGNTTKHGTLVPPLRKPAKQPRLPWPVTSPAPFTALPSSSSSMSRKHALHSTELVQKYHNEWKMRLMETDLFEHYFSRSIKDDDTFHHLSTDALWPAGCRGPGPTTPRFCNRWARYCIFGEFLYL